jgi:hypothetical protein
LKALIPDSTSKIYIQNTAVIYPQISGFCTATGVLQLYTCTGTGFLRVNYCCILDVYFTCAVWHVHHIFPVVTNILIVHFYYVITGYGQLKQQHGDVSFKCPASFGNDQTGSKRSDSEPNLNSFKHSTKPTTQFWTSDATNTGACKGFDLNIRVKNP